MKSEEHLVMTGKPGRQWAPEVSASSLFTSMGLYVSAERFLAQIFRLSDAEISTSNEILWC